MGLTYATQAPYGGDEETAPFPQIRDWEHRDILRGPRHMACEACSRFSMSPTLASATKKLPDFAGDPQWDPEKAFSMLPNLRVPGTPVG